MSARQTSPCTAELAAGQLWGGPRLGAELNGLCTRHEIPPKVP